jgi:hypothetical protein
MGADSYRNGPITPSARGFGKRPTASPFQDPLAAFAGRGRGDLTGEENYVRDFFKRKPPASGKAVIPIMLGVFVFVAFMNMAVDPAPTKLRSGSDVKPVPKPAGCFEQVLDANPAGVYPVSLNPSLIEAYRQHRAQGDVPAFEKYVALHRSALLDAQLASSASRDVALIEYAAKRKLHFDAAALFFGSDGVRAMLAEYRTPADAALLEELKTRLRSPVRLASGLSVSTSELIILANAPEKFLSCRTPTADRRMTVS